MKPAAKSELFRALPSVDELVRTPELQLLIEREGRVPVTDAVRRLLDNLRQEIANDQLDEAAIKLALDNIRDAVEQQLRSSLSYSLRTVINATGVILHTNLGRAPLSSRAVAHISKTSGEYSNLEFDIPSGERGKRDVHADRLFERIFSDDAPGTRTIVVNNNAAAVLLALNTLAEGGEVIVSRGELVEIGGSFRVPDVMAKSGAVLREVGTTNRTRPADYEQAINERTRLILRVHRSNFSIVGFTEQPPLEKLVRLAHKHGLPILEDLGSGALFDLRQVGIHGEPTVAESLRAGVDVVTYSGDKLLGGPQAGIISGQPELVGRIRSNPLFRALRVDKLTYAALEATLLAYIRQDYDALPALRMMRLSVEQIEQRAQAVIENLRDAQRLRVELVQSESVIGGGSAPGSTLPTRAIAVTCDGLSADGLAAQLRTGEPCIVARVEEGRVLLDLRTVMPEQDESVISALKRISVG